jgi:hypothetical protein
MVELTLEELRDKAFFQNTIDVWIMLCDERNVDWYSLDGYRAFINHIKRTGVIMQKFPLCIKESGGLFERGRDKTKFLEELSKLPFDDTTAYTIKLSESMIEKIRSFNDKKSQIDEK